MADFLDFLVFRPNLNKSILLFFLLIVKSALNILLKKFVGKKLLKLRKNEDKIYELLIYYSFALDFHINEIIISILFQKYILFPPKI